MQNGLFVGTAPYGYRNVRIDGRGLVETDPDESVKIRTIFLWYAYGNLTIDGIIDRLAAEGTPYCPSVPKWSRAKIHNILRDRAYIGEVRYQGQWHLGKQTPIIDRAVWDRVQALLGEKVYKGHELAYAGQLIRCAHCGSFVTGEAITKKQTGKVYNYYRCVKYKATGHPPVRLTEAKLDEQVIGMFRRMKMPEDIASCLSRMMRLWVLDRQKGAREKATAIQKQIDGLRKQEDVLLNMRLLGEIEQDTYSAKATELRDRVSGLKLKLDACDRGSDEVGDLASKAFELTQRLEDKWLTADAPEKRQILEMLCLNLKLDGVTLVPAWRKPFDLLAEGLHLKNSRGDKI